MKRIAIQNRCLCGWGLFPDISTHIFSIFFYIIERINSARHSHWRLWHPNSLRIIYFHFNKIEFSFFSTFLPIADENVKWIAIAKCFQWNHVIYRRRRVEVVYLLRLQRLKSKSVHRPQHRQLCRIHRRRHQHPQRRRPFRQHWAAARPAHIITPIINRYRVYRVWRPPHGTRPRYTSMSVAQSIRVRWKHSRDTRTHDWPNCSTAPFRLSWIRWSNTISSIATVACSGTFWILCGIRNYWFPTISPISICYWKKHVTST